MNDWRRRGIVLLALAGCLAWPSAAHANPVVGPDWPLPVLILVFTVSGVFVECLVAAAYELNRRIIATVAVMNVITIPVANVMVVLLLLLAQRILLRDSMSYWYLPLTVGLAEVAVVYVEYRILVHRISAFGWSRSRILGMSALMNLLSFLAGAVWWVIGAMFPLA